MEATILQELTELSQMPLASLRERWRSLYGTEPPKYKRQYLIKRLAYRIQELAYGGLSKQAKSELEQIAEQNDNQRQNARTQRRKPKNTHPVPGTRIVREWKNQRHEVTAVEGGFEYNGRRYKSLSAVAKTITGAHWSGPHFFGLWTTKRGNGQ